MIDIGVLVLVGMVRLYAAQDAKCKNLEQVTVGELLADTVKAVKPKLSHDATVRLPDIGMNCTQSSRWQAIASDD